MGDLYTFLQNNIIVRSYRDVWRWTLNKYWTYGVRDMAVVIEEKGSIEIQV